MFLADKTQAQENLTRSAEEQKEESIRLKPQLSSITSLDRICTHSFSMTTQLHSSCIVGFTQLTIRKPVIDKKLAFFLI